MGSTKSRGQPSSVRSARNTRGIGIPGIVVIQEKPPASSLAGPHGPKTTGSRLEWRSAPCATAGTAPTHTHNPGATVRLVRGTPVVCPPHLHLSSRNASNDWPVASYPKYRGEEPIAFFALRPASIIVPTALSGRVDASGTAGGRDRSFS